MKVLFPFVGDSVGGSHNSVLELYFSLKKKKNITPVILLHNKGPLSDFLRKKNVSFEYMPSKKLAGESPNLLKIASGVLLNFFLLKNYLKNNNIHIVHGNDLRINLTWSLPVRFSNAAFVWHQRTTLSNSILWKLIRFLGDHFVAISSHVFNTLPKNLISSKKSLIYNPFDLDSKYDKKQSRNWITSSYNLPSDFFLFGYVGRLIEWKNVDGLLVHFAKLIKTTNQKVFLLIAGTGKPHYLQKLKSQLIDLEIEDYVLFLGFQTDPNKIIASLDLLVTSSDNEPFGRTVVEAMLQKTPVLAAYGGGHNETIIPDKNGYLYNHNSSSDFIYQCNKFLENINERKKIISEGYKTAHLSFSSSKHSDKILNIYKKITI